MNSRIIQEISGNARSLTEWPGLMKAFLFDKEKIGGFPPHQIGSLYGCWRISKNWEIPKNNVIPSIARTTKIKNARIRSPGSVKARNALKVDVLWTTLSPFMVAINPHMDAAIAPRMGMMLKRLTDPVTQAIVEKVACQL